MGKNVAWPFSNLPLSNEDVPRVSGHVSMEEMDIAVRLASLSPFISRIIQEADLWFAVYLIQ